MEVNCVLDKSCFHDVKGQKEACLGDRMVDEEVETVS